MLHERHTKAGGKIVDMLMTAAAPAIQWVHMKEILQGTAKQLIPIFLAAVGAGAIAFAQSFFSHAGLCPAPSLTPEQTGLLGASLKALHSVYATATSTNA